MSGVATARTNQPTGERKGLAAYLVVAASAVALVVMRQVSAQLGRLEIGHDSATMSVLTQPHLTHHPLDEAGLLWAYADSREQAATLIRAHVWTDFGFLVSYAFLLLWLLRRTTTHGRTTPEGPAAPLPRWASIVLALTVAADVVENVFTLFFAGRVASGKDPSTALDWALYVATWAKWGFLAFLLLSALRHALLGRRDAQQKRTRPRVWRRHRVQIGAVAVLALLVAVPAGGPLDQLPDVLRTIADGKHIRGGELLSSFATLALFCLALEVAGRWAILDDLRNADGSQPKRWRATPPWAVFTVGGGLLLPALVLRYWAAPGSLTFNNGVFALPLVLGIVGIAPRLFSLPFCKAGGEDPRDVDLPGPVRDDVRRAGRFLATLPVAIAGLGLTRAFADPVFAGPVTKTGESYAYFWIGVGTVLIVAPAVYLMLAVLERWLLADRGRTGSSVRPAPGDWLGAAVFLAAAALAVVAAVHPLSAGPLLNATGVVTVFLALVTVSGGMLQRIVERQMPYALTPRLNLGQRSPVFVVATAVFVVAGLLNTQGGYHAVRLASGGGAPSDWSLQGGFDEWLAQAQECTVGGSYAANGRDTVPLVLVAAPGGGIRAAYWAEHALDAMRQDDGCADQRVFAASGVSGGSVGLVAHYAGGSADAVAEMSEEAPLAASMAGMFFRDLPAGAVGLTSGWADRAALLESAWSEVDGALDTTHLVDDLAPGADGEAGWQPLLLLNGTEVSTGCRVVIAAVSVVASDSNGAPQSCLGSGIEAGSDGFVPGVDILDFRDAKACDGDSVRDGDLRASTAALLSARFPYVSPSAELFRCASENGDEEPVRAADLDGGAAENSGLATVLDLWDRLGPIVAAHNESVEAGTPDGPDVVVMPLLVLVDNHYATGVVPGHAERQRELSAPANLPAAKGVLAGQGVLEQQSMLAFAGPPPGVADGDEQLVRFFRVGPVRRPGVAAPLGWTLSDMTREELDAQLDDTAKLPCRNDDEIRAPLPLSCYRAAVSAAG